VAVRPELSRLAHWDELVANSTTAVIVTDVEGRIVIWNAAATAHFGWTSEQALGLKASQLVLTPDLDRLAAAAMLAGERWTADIECKRRDGSRVPTHLTLSALHDDARAVIGYLSESRDLSDLRAAESRLDNTVIELRAAAARQEAIVARSRDATLFFDADGTIRWASSISYELIGIAPETLLGMNGLDFIHPDDQERVFAEFIGMANLGDHVRTEFRIVGTGSDVRWVEEDATNLVDDPDVGYVVANVRDITERKHAEARFERLALHDQLTGLPNRSLLADRLEQLLARGSAAAVLFVDIDNFGDVNDSLGHAAGDELLRLVADRLVAALTSWPSTLARVGADEFIVLCGDLDDATAAFAFAERLRQCLKPPVRLVDQDVFVTVSIGVAMSPGDATSLVRDAGIAAHQAKQQGRDRVVMSGALLDVRQQHRLALQSELHRALAHHEFVVWHQPIVDLQADRVIGVEALVRWNHPQRGLLAPEHFIDIAETSGLVCALGSEVLRQACAAVRTWRQLGHRFGVSINAAAAQISSRDYVTEIESALHEFEIEPGMVTIELTETAAMQVADSLDNLRRIRALGVHLSLDDFGTGYSSLSFLRDLPVDAIKIDRSFVSGLATSPRDASIVEGVIAIAAALGHKVVAEGVETTAQADKLRVLGCGYAQGFLWSQPVRAADIPAVSERIRPATQTNA
jgi:diguanylate cyclase (GGDEF)-like protein/PAS domain S-box-containing protein